MGILTTVLPDGKHHWRLDGDDGTWSFFGYPSSKSAEKAARDLIERVEAEEEADAAIHH